MHVQLHQADIGHGRCAPHRFAKANKLFSYSALALFISATFLALVIQNVQRQLHVVEIYVILLLTFGAYIFLLPLLFWRLMTGFNPLSDPTRFSLVDPGPTHSDLHSLLFLAVTGFQLWFWIIKVTELDSMYCGRYGFFFAKVPLDDRAFQIANIVIYFVLGVSVLTMLTLRVNRVCKGSSRSEEDAEWDELEDRHDRDWLDHRIHTLQMLNLVKNIITSTVIVVGTELTISWNRIAGVYCLASAGQLIPFVIGLGVLSRVMYVWLKEGYRQPSARRRPRPPWEVELGSSLSSPTPPPIHRRSRRPAHSIDPIEE